jgi:predicted RNase H-related nuclease YkuK (DUF458 family)
MPIKETTPRIKKTIAPVEAAAAPTFFNSSLGARLTAPEVVQEIMNYMDADLTRRYKVTIGTDSELLSNKNADFVTAIVVHRIGNGGRYFWRRFELGKFHTLRDRMIQEVLISLDIAKEVLTELKKFPLPEFEFEIHADIGPNGPTNAVIQEIVGMIRAHNFEVRTKPDSYAASNVADRHV